jgi:hypothetical protein
VRGRISVYFTVLTTHEERGKKTEKTRKEKTEERKIDLGARMTSAWKDEESLPRLVLPGKVQLV